MSSQSDITYTKKLFYFAVFIILGITGIKFGIGDIGNGKLGIVHLSINVFVLLKIICTICRTIKISV